MSENKKIKNATPYTYQGIKFRSKMEVTVFKLLLEKGLNPLYESETITLMRGFKPETPFYTKNKKTKQLTLNVTKIIDWKYTPDFVVEYMGHKFYIEVKGMENDVYRYKRKMFLQYLRDKPNTAFFEIYTKQNAEVMAEVILSYGDQGV